MELPFLKNKRWPRVLGQVPVMSYGYSEDEELIDRLLDELIAAYTAKDGAELCRVFQAIVELIEMGERDADASEEA